MTGIDDSNLKLISILIKYHNHTFSKVNLGSETAH